MTEYDLDEFDTEWTMPFTDHYTGPWRSDGKWQTSVAYGKSKPKSKLDSISRDHDTAYALCSGDIGCLTAADDRYYDRTRDMSLFPRLVGSLVKHGNRLTRKGGGGGNKDQMFLAPLAISAAVTAVAGYAVNSSNVGKKSPELKVVTVYNPQYTPQGGIIEEEVPAGVTYQPVQSDAKPAAAQPPVMYDPKSLDSTQEFLAIRDGVEDSVLSTPRGSFYAPVGQRLSLRGSRKKRKKNKIYVA